MGAEGAGEQGWECLGNEEMKLFLSHAAKRTSTSPPRCDQGPGGSYCQCGGQDRSPVARA